MDTGRPDEGSYPGLFPKDFRQRLERLTEIAGRSLAEFTARLGDR